MILSYSSQIHGLLDPSSLFQGLKVATVVVLDHQCFGACRLPTTPADLGSLFIAIIAASSSMSAVSGLIIIHMCHKDV